MEGGRIICEDPKVETSLDLRGVEGLSKPRDWGGQWVGGIRKCWSGAYPAGMPGWAFECILCVIGRPWRSFVPIAKTSSLVFQETWTHILILTSSKTLSKFLCLFGPQCLHLYTQLLFLVFIHCCMEEKTDSDLASRFLRLTMQSCVCLNPEPRFPDSQPRTLSSGHAASPARW